MAFAAGSWAAAAAAFLNPGGPSARHQKAVATPTRVVNRAPPQLDVSGDGFRRSGRGGAWPPSRLMEKGAAVATATATVETDGPERGGGGGALQRACKEGARRRVRTDGARAIAGSSDSVGSRCSASATRGSVRPPAATLLTAKPTGAEMRETSSKQSRGQGTWKSHAHQPDDTDGHVAWLFARLANGRHLVAAVRSHERPAQCDVSRSRSLASPCLRHECWGAHVCGNVGLGPRL